MLELITAGASLLGGVLGQRNSNKQARLAREATDPATIRRKAEAAGFNPLLFTGQAFSTAGAMSQPILGSAIADAASVYLNTRFREQELQLQRTRLEQENQRLTDLVSAATLRPPIGGIYSGNNARGGPRVSRPSVLAESTVGSRPVTIEHGPLRGVEYYPHSPEVQTRTEHLNTTYVSDDFSVDIPVGPDVDEVLTGAVISAGGVFQDLFDDPSQYARDTARTAFDIIRGAGAFTGRAIDAILPYSGGVYGLQSAPERIVEGVRGSVVPRDDTPFMSYGLHPDDMPRH